MSIQLIGIVGSGFMCSEMALASILKDLSVLLVDTRKDQLEKTIDYIKSSINKRVQKGELNEDRSSLVLERVRLSLDIKALSEADFILESLTDDEQVKTELFKKLDQIGRPDIVLASNIRTVSVTLVAQATKREEKVIGFHLLPPASELKLVEIIRGVKTSDETLRITRGLLEILNLPYIIAHDFPGCIFDRILLSTINEAVSTLYEGVGTAIEIDKAMTIGLGHSMGPLRLADSIGLDKVLTSLKVLYQSTGNSRFIPSPLLKKYVEAGYIGKQAGKGFFEYSHQKY